MRAGGGSGAGWGWALTSSACFSTSGSLATPLIHSGWSPGAAVTVRITIAGLLLAIPAARSLRGRWNLLRGNVRMLTLYGLIAVAGGQLFFFNALSTLKVGVALLLEYLGMLMVVTWLWIRHHQRPRPLTLAGSGLAVAGLVLVLDLVGSGVQVDPIGVLWGLASAVGLAIYFVMSARADSGVPPLVLACAGLLIGAAAMGALGAVGVFPMHAAAADVVLAGHQFPWWVPIAAIATISTAVPYVAGIAGVRILGPKLGSFVSLAEVLCAVLVAWLVLGQLPALIQLAGGALIVGGVAFIRADEMRGPRRPAVATGAPAQSMSGR